MKFRLPKNRKLNISLYIGGLCMISLVLYSTIFAGTYHSNYTSSTPTGTPSVDPTTGLVYKTYPEKGKKTTILLDAGHGGMDGGNTVNDTILEKDINLSITNKVADYLNELNPNIIVKMIRTDDSVPWLTDELSDLNYRLEQQTKQSAEYFFSIHCNSYADPSIEGAVFFVNPTDEVMKDLTNKMGKNFQEIQWCQQYSIVDNQLLQVVTMSEIHSTLIELGYMSNAENLAHLTNSSEQDKVAKTIAATISDFVMENPDAPKYEKPKPESTTQSASSMASAESQAGSLVASKQSEQDANSAQDSAANSQTDPNQPNNPDPNQDVNQPANPEQPPAEDPIPPAEETPQPLS